MIVVEWPDGAGKTTLAQALARDLGLELMPRLVSTSAEELVDLKVWVEQNTQLGFVPKVKDRHPLISELIYGPATRSSMREGFGSIGWLSSWLASFYASGPIIIYCLPPLDVVRDNVDQDASSHWMIDKLPDIYHAYHMRCALDMARLGPEEVISWDYTDPGGHDHEALLAEIRSGLKRRSF